MMTRINFIPKHRRELARARRRLRAWMCIVAVYGVAVALGCVLSYTALAEDDQALAAKLRELPGEIEQSQNRLDATRRELSASQSKLAAVRTIAHQPDWGVLLSVLADVTGDDVVLNGCRLDPIAAPQGQSSPRAGPGAAPRAAGAHDAAGGYVLLISGTAPTQRAVSQLLLRLEQVGLFRKVTLLKTTRELRDDGETVAFRIEASLAPAEGG